MLSKNRYLPIVAFIILVVAAVACGQPAEEWQTRGWTVTPSFTPDAEPTQTPIYVEITTTPIYVEITNTPATINQICVVASNVNLRPSASDDNYPIVSLPNGSHVNNLGGRNGSWWLYLLGVIRAGSILIIWGHARY